MLNDKKFFVNSLDVLPILHRSDIAIVSLDNVDIYGLGTFQMFNTLDQLDDEFDNNDGKDVGINGVIEMTILLKSHKFKSIFVGIKLGSQ